VNIHWSERLLRCGAVAAATSRGSFLVVDAAVQALATADADFDFYHIQASWRVSAVVELKPASAPGEPPVREGVVKRPS